MQRLRFVSELPERYHHVFPEFTTFNFIQSALMDFLMKTDISVVVSAPTGSGKTTLFEIAIIKLLEMWEHSNEEDKEQKIVYMAPIKALCTEKFREWDDKFTSLGIRAIEITGDSDGSDLLTIQHFNLILTTPEKWDALTRKWKDHSSLIQMIKLFLIDEVHLLNEERRGPTLEAVVSRMKTVQESLDCNEAASDWIRFIAVSATIPNIEDIAAWLSLKPKAAKFFKFGEEMRPVHLKRIIKAYPCKDERTIGYKFDLSLNYKLKQLIMQYSEGKPTLIFCSTRKSVLMTANVLCQQISFHFTPDQRENIEAAAEYLLDNKLKEIVRRGVAYHHAGLVVSDRHCIEELFRSGYLPVLVSTSTLAMGVNLPANLVIIKSTEQYVCGGWQEYSEGQILQMVGRAGRPQFGNSAAAIILTKDVNKEKYEKLVHGKEMIESTLHRHLVEHLNAEIVLGTITDIAVAMNWIKSTYLYVRALKNPKHYGIPAGLSPKELEARLQDMCLRELHALENYQVIVTTEMAYNVEPTENGKLMAKYYLAFETMKIFMKIKGNENLSEMLDILSRCHEFEDIQLRTNEKSILNLMNNHKQEEFIRFPLQGKVKTSQMKTNCLIQSVLGALQIGDFSLKQEAVKIIRLAQRLLNGLSLYLWQRDCYQALASTLILSKCVQARLWENSPYVCRQLPGIGPALASLLVSANKTTFQTILESNPRDLERIINRKPPMGNQLQEAAAKIPQYEIEVSYNSSDKKIIIMLKILNAFEVQYGNTLHRCSLLVADSNNNLLKKEKICDQAILAHCGEFQFYVLIRHQENVNEFIVHLISESLVGIDVKYTYKIIGGAAVKQPDSCQPGNNVKLLKPVKTVKANTKGNNNKTSNVSNKKPPKDNKSAKKQIQYSLEHYSFVPKRSKILRHRETLLNEENEVTSTQDIRSRSHYFSCDYEPQKNIKSAPILSTQQSMFQPDYSTFDSDMNYDICKEIDTYCISDTDDEDCTDSGISSFNKSMLSGNSSKQLDPVFKNIGQIKGKLQPSHSGNSNVLLNEFKDGSKMLFERKPILLSPSSTFNSKIDEEPIEEKTLLNKKCFYPLFMPYGSQSLENSVEMRDNVSILEATEKSQDIKGFICPKTAVTEICNEDKENLKRTAESNPVDRKVDCPLAKQNFDKLTNENELLNEKTQILCEKVIGSNEHIDQSVDEKISEEEIFNEDSLLNIDTEQSLDDDISLESADDGICKNKNNSGNNIEQNSLKDINVQNDQSCSLNEKLETRNNKNELKNQCFSETSIEKRNQEQQICNNNIDDRNVIFEELQKLTEEKTNTVTTKIHSKQHSEMKLSNKFANDNKPSNNNNFKDENKVIPEVTMSSSQNLGFDVDELLEQSPKKEEKENTISPLSSASDAEPSQFEINKLATVDNLDLLNLQKLKNQYLFQRKQPVKDEERINIPYQICKDEIKIRQAARLEMVSNKENLPPFINNCSNSRRFVESGSLSFNINNKICEQEPNQESFVYQPPPSGTHVELNDVELDNYIDSICEQNYLRDGYGDPFAPLYPSSALNNMTEVGNNSEEQTSTINQKQPSMTMYNEYGIPSNRHYELHESDFNRSKCSQAFTRQTDTTNTVHCFGTPAWAVPSISSDHHHWSSNTHCRQPLSSLNNYSLSQHRPPNFGNIIERQYSPCSNPENYGEHLFIEDTQKHQTSVFGQKSFNKLPTSQSYFRKFKPRYGTRCKNSRKLPFSYNASSSMHNRQPAYVDAHQGMKNSSVLQKAGSFSQRNATPAENQDYRKRFYHNQQGMKSCGSVQGETFERSTYPLGRKKIPYKQPEQPSYSVTAHPSQMFALFDNASNSQYISQRGSTSVFGMDEENEGLDQFQFTTDIINSPLAEEYQPMSGNFSFPVTHNVHEMSPSPPMSGDEFQDITNQETVSPDEKPNFEHFYFNKENPLF